MKALWLKDFYSVRKYLILLAMGMVLFLIIGSFLSLPALIGVVVGPYLIIFLMMTIYLMNLDLNENFYAYGLTFPMARKTILLVKYGEFLMMQGLILIMGLGGFFIVKRLGIGPQPVYLMTSAVFCLWSFYMLYYPLVLKFNPKESVYPSLILITPGIVGPLLGRLKNLGWISKDYIDITQLTWIFVGSGIFFLLLSLVCSYRIMMRKEF